MKNKEILNRLAGEIRDITPDVSGKLSLNSPENKTEVIKMSQKPNKKLKRWIIGVSAAAVMALAVGLGFSGYRYYSVDTVIGIDVNPSIELKINKNETVIDAVALNSDAEVILDEMKLSGVDYNVAVNALIGSMLKNGYIDELKNSILISVDNADAQKSAELEERLMKEINEILSGSSVEPALLAQSVSGDAQLEELAAKYNISLGRASLIQKICDADPTKTFDALAQLSVNDLYLLAESKSVSSSGVLSQGSPSAGAYISADDAKSAALSHAGVSADSAEFISYEMDFDDGRMIYEIEFLAGGVKYEYEIDAESAAVIKQETENAGGSSGAGSSGAGSSSAGSSGAAITREQAQEIALNHAGISVSDITVSKLELDDNKYDFEFISGGYKYDYEISASTGNIVEWKKEAASNSSGSSSSGSSGAAVTPDKAKSIALGDAGVTDIYGYEIDYDRDDNKYEIEFSAGGYEYEYEINASTGDIIKKEKDR